MDFILYTFHMPLFFFLAGLNVPHSLRRGNGPLLRIQLWTVAYPYVLWSLIQGILILIMTLARDVNVPLTVSDLAAIPYRPLAQFWFLYALMICHVLVVLIPKRAVLGVISGLGLGVFLLLPVRPDLALTLHHLPLYVAGLYASRVMVGWRPPSPGAGVLLWIGFGLSVLAAGLISSDRNGLAATPACLFGVAGTL